jgi:hypothetical protein
MRVHIRTFTSSLDSEVIVLDTDLPEEQDLVLRYVEALTKKFPGNDFKVVKIGKRRYNVIPQPQARA